MPFREMRVAFVVAPYTHARCASPGRKVDWWATEGKGRSQPDTYAEETFVAEACAGAGLRGMRCRMASLMRLAA